MITLHNKSNLPLVFGGQFFSEGAVITVPVMAFGAKVHDIDGNELNVDRNIEGIIFT